MGNIEVVAAHVKGLNATELYALKWLRWRNSPAVQWVGFCAATVGTRVQSLVGQLRACKLHGTAKINKHTQNLKIF